MAEKRPLRKIRDLDDKVGAVRGKPEVFAEFRKSVARQTRGFRAPENCIKAVEAAVNLPFDQGMKRERELFQELITSPESKAQRYFFFAEREAAKIPDVPGDTKSRDIKKAAVLGAGTMGGGIAMNFANAGIPVTVVEVAQDALDRGLGVVRKNYEATAARGRLTPQDVEKRMGLISGTTDWSQDRRRRHRGRGGLRGDADQEGGLRQDRQDLQAGRGARLQHLHARRGRDRLRDQAAGRASSACTSSAPPT